MMKSAVRGNTIVFSNSPLFYSKILQFFKFRNYCRTLLLGQPGLEIERRHYISWENHIIIIYYYYIIIILLLSLLYYYYYDS